MVEHGEIWHTKEWYLLRKDNMLVDLVIMFGGVKSQQENRWDYISRSVLDTTLCDKVCQWLTIGRWFSQGTAVSSSIKTDRHEITEILLKAALNTIKPRKKIVFCILIFTCECYHRLKISITKKEGPPLSW